MSGNWMNRLSCRGLVILQTMLTFTCPITAWADPFIDLQRDVVIEQELDSMRGGFTSADGLEISFGIEQAVFIDGVLQLATNLKTLEVTNMLRKQGVPGKTDPMVTQGLNIMQSDFSTVTMAVDGIGSRIDTIIQNSGNQRVIDSITLINASVSSLGLFRELNLLNTLQQQQISIRQ